MVMQTILIILVAISLLIAIFLITQTKRHTSHSTVEKKVNDFLEEHLEIHKSKKITKASKNTSSKK
jgi:uncharacterized membrane protein